MPLSIEMHPEWLTRHGYKSRRDLIEVEKGTWMLPDGATLQNRGAEPQYFEPPTGPRQLLEARKRYHSTKAAIYENAFRSLKFALLGQTPMPFIWNVEQLGPDPGGDGIPALAYLRQQYSKERNAITEIDDQIQELPEVQALKQRQEKQRQFEADQRAIAAAFREAVMKIDLPDGQM